MVNQDQIEVYGGLDTHADTHHFAAIDGVGRRLADAQIPATAAGYQAALCFLRSCPGPVTVGIERTGSYGAGSRQSLRVA